MDMVRRGRAWPSAPSVAGGTVAAVEGQILLLAADAIAKVSIAPLERSMDLFGVGVEQQLVGIEPQAVSWFVGAMNTVSIKQPRACFGQIPVPHLVGLFGKRYAVQFASSAGVEKA